jgi:hypothetical protein
VNSRRKLRRNYRLNAKLVERARSTAVRLRRTETQIIEAGLSSLLSLKPNEIERTIRAVDDSQESTR